MPRFIDMMDLVDLSHEGIDRLVGHHLEVVVVAELLDDQHLAEERDLFFALRVLAGEDELLLGIDLAGVAIAELAEHDHVLVFFVDEVVEVLGDRARIEGRP